MRSRFVRVLTVLLTLTIALSGCAGRKAGDSSKIVVGIPQDLEDSLDPHKAVAAGTREVLFNVFEGLLKPDENGELIPAVAESYTVSDDGLTYTFTIRNGIKFHNGNRVTAEDVKYSIEKSAGMTGEESLIAAFSNIKEVSIVDKSTVAIILKERDVDFPAYLSAVSASIIPADNAMPDTTAIGTGPYKYVSRSPQENIVMTRFDSYWGEPAHIRDVEFKVEANSDAMLLALKGGTIDMCARLTTTQASQLTSNFVIHEGSMNLVQALYLNHASKPFDDIRVRQALCYAADKQEIIDIAFEGKGSPLGSSMFPAFGKYYIPELTDYYTPDISRARELLAEAGYPDGFDMTITVPSNYQPHVDTAQVLVEEFKKIGINASIQQVEWNTWLSDVYTNRKYEATVIGVDATQMTANAMLSRFYSKAEDNFTNYSNEEYDRLFEEAQATTDDEKRTELFKKMETLLAEDAANVYIQDMAEMVPISKNIEGYVFYPLYVQDIAKLYYTEDK
ncbi:MAG: ABC transporter substrate-binding protein [Lachnospiraceae bacterium]|nr:ABC transporter substrate-binding protein [Lachnospiraceae bacterium]